LVPASGGSGYAYPIRLLDDNVLRGKIAHQLTRPVGRPSLTKVKRLFEDFEYQAQSWEDDRRVVAKIEWRLGELFSRVGFIVTSLPIEPDWVVRSTTDAALPSSTSKNANMPSTGRGCRARDSTAMRCSCNGTHWPTNWPPSCAASSRLGHVRWVFDKPPAQADQDRGLCRLPCPRHYRPTGRGGHQRLIGARHLCSHPPPSRATAVHVTAILTQTERKPEDKSNRRAEKRCCQARALRVRGPIRPVPGVSATADAALGEKTCSTGKIKRPCRPVEDHLGNVGFGV
jgi:Transposase DDE domain group 1